MFYKNNTDMWDYGLFCVFCFVEKKKKRERDDKFKLIWLQAYWNKILSVPHSPPYTEALAGPSYKSYTAVDVATTNIASKEDK